MSIRKPNPKTAVALIRSTFASLQSGSTTLSTKDAYNLLAQLEGYKNWAHGKNALDRGTAGPVEELPKLGYIAAEIAAWPTFVIFMKWDEEASDDVFYVLPAGITLQSRSNTRYSYEPFNESGSMLLPELFQDCLTDKALVDSRRESLVVKEVFSVIPRPDRYGVPHYANDLGVADWVVEDLGWNFLAYRDETGVAHNAIQVDFQDSGDDSGGRYWMEVAGAPAIAARIESAFCSQVTSVQEVCA